MRTKTIRKYSLFTRPYGTRRWARVICQATAQPFSAYSKELAIRMFQSALIASALNDPENEVQLRPVKS